MAIAQRSWSPFSKTFSIPSREEMEWVNVINNAYLSRDGLTINEISKDHIVKDFMVNYRFDRETAELLYKLQENILEVAIKENWSNRKIIHEYNSLIASLVPDNYVSFRWKSVAGTIDTFYLKKFLKRLNFSGNEVEKLFENVTNQHKFAAYKDLAHEAVQLSAYTNIGEHYQLDTWEWFTHYLTLGRLGSDIVNTDIEVFRSMTPLNKGVTKINTKEDIMFKLKNWNFESKEISYKGDIDSGRYDDGDFNSDLDPINTLNPMMKANKQDIFKVQTQYNFRVKNNTINRVGEFYKVHGDGDYERGKTAVQRIVNTDTIATRYISSKYNKEQREEHKKDFFDYLDRGKFKNVE